MNAGILCIITCCILLSIFALNGCTPKQEHAAELLFSRDTIEIGKVHSKSPVNTSFSFKNVGDDSLKIFNVEPSCNCTAVGGFKKTVAPGASGEILIHFDPSNLITGRFTRRIAVLSNSRTQIKILVLQGTKIEN